ncbi:hypothetical protein E5161_14870 [Cohnella pontilimi]|uniref:Uncharacterized protein n=1 Tax=Cohnella pontilimi TaxID=2564100 RepID=A0A4U0F8D6_9BACL|nr:hypothetical protein [Cohnella pontilimi]TJY40993.1 hypothetical protein E5161_14870 [Cohnella pontilimi]
MLLESRFGAIAAVLRGRKSLPPLTPERVWHPGLDTQIRAISVLELADGRPDGLPSAQAWKAAVHLWNDGLDSAHDLVQDLETPTGALLHGIMHRRERDYSNAKYWFRRAGDHPVYHLLQGRVSERMERMREADGLPAGPVREAIGAVAGQTVWNPYLFTDAVHIVENRIGDDQARTVLEHIQHLELEAVLRYLESRLA